MSDLPPPPPPPPPGGGQQPPPPPPPPPGGGGGPQLYQPPPPSYGTPPPIGGAPPPAQFGSYAPQAAGGYGGAAPIADFGKRALSGLIDWFGPVFVALFVGWFVSSALGFLLQLAALGWGLYNAYLGGQTGQSIGKKQAGIRLISEDTGQVIGGGMGIARAFVHIIDAIPCYLGFLLPLIDNKKQTIADKILKTVVVTA